MWGVIVSVLEGRRVTDLLASLFGLSIAVSSGTAKSIGLFVVDTLHVSEFWMPALISAVALPLLAGLGDRKSTRLNSSHSRASRMPSSA